MYNTKYRLPTLLNVVSDTVKYIFVTRSTKRGLIHTVLGLTFHGYSTDTTIDQQFMLVHTIAKASTVCFYRGLIHGPVCHPRMLRWSVNGSNLPGQADSQQGITTGLAGETGH